MFNSILLKSAVNYVNQKTPAIPPKMYDANLNNLRSCCSNILMVNSSLVFKVLLIFYVPGEDLNDHKRGSRDCYLLHF